MPHLGFLSLKIGSEVAQSRFAASPEHRVRTKCNNSQIVVRSAGNCQARRETQMLNYFETCEIPRI